MDTLTNSTADDNAELLAKASAEKLKTYIPLVTWFSVILISGLPGNVFILLYYGRKVKSSTSSVSFFITVMACADLFQCFFTLPVAIWDFLTPYYFSNDALCRVKYYLIFVACIVSLLASLGVAIERYIAICKRNTSKRSMSKWKTILFLILPSVVISVPSIFFIESVPVTVIVDSVNVTGHICIPTLRDQYAVPFIVYNMLVFVAVFSEIVIIAALYIFVTRTLKEHRQRLFGTVSKKKGPSYQAELSSQNETEDNTTSAADAVFSDASPGEFQELTMTTDTVVTESPRLPRDDRSNDDRNGGGPSANTLTVVSETRRSGKRHKHKTGTADRRRHLESERVTYIMMAITALMLVTFFPYFGITIYQIVRRGDANVLSPWFQLFWYGVLLSSGSNHFVYGSFDSQFRAFVSGIVCKICHKADCFKENGKTQEP